MISSEIRDLIRFEIRKQINVLLPGFSQNCSATTEDIVNMYSGIGNTLPKSPIMRPFGYSSNTPDGTLQVVGRVGDHEAARMVLGHRDANVPLPPAQGESAVYSVGGYQMRVRNGLIEIGKNGTFEPQVMGETLRDFLISLVDLIVTHQHLGNLGFQTSVPLNASSFNTLKADNLDNKFILCENGGRF